MDGILVALKDRGLVFEPLFNNLTDDERLLIHTLEEAVCPWIVDMFNECCLHLFRDLHP